MLEIIIAAIAVAALALLLLLLKSRSSQNNPPQKPQATQAKKEEEEIILEEPSEKTEAKSGKKKKKKTSDSALPEPATQIKTAKELEEIYQDMYYGSVNLKGNKNISNVTCLAIKHSKILVGNSKNELVLFDLRRWKPHSACQDQYFTSLDNSTATAVALSPNYYLAALDFDKTIIVFEFKGGEGGVYFKMVRKFPRNIFKGNQGSLHVPEHERFVVSTGVEADTSISVWSMEGEKLASIGTYQIEHYDVQYGGPYILVRGWTSEVKSFQLTTDKEGNFGKIEKNFHLTLSEKPAASVIDNFGLHALTITGDGEQVKLWELKPSQFSHPIEKTVETCQIGLGIAKHCAVLTLKEENERLKTLIVVSSDNKFVLLDR